MIIEQKLNKESLNEAPFLGSYYTNNEEIEAIWNHLNDNKTPLPKNMEIFKKVDKEKYFAVSIKKQNKIIEEFNFLKIPINITIDELIENKKIYIIEQCQSILNILQRLNYIIIIDGEEFKNEKFNIYEIKKIEAKSKEKTNFIKYINRKKVELTIEESIKELDFEIISFYFNDICISNNVKKKGKFNFILDENRKNFIEKINKFLSSNNLFYFILGTDGIGKTVSILYYSSMVGDYRKLYLNLKFLSKNDNINIEEIFFNEVKRIFLTNDDENGHLESYYYLYIKFINNIKNKINNENLNGIKFAWKLLFLFLDEYNILNLIDRNINIILDQYKTNLIDEDFIYLNNLTSYIFNNNFTYNIKLILISSINNYDIKDIFLDNLNFI